MRTTLLLSTTLLVLTGCVQHREVLSVPNDPDIMHGSWTGYATPSLSTVQVLLDAKGDRTYQLIRGEVAPRLLLRDATSGEVLKEVTLRADLDPQGLGVRNDDRLVVASPGGSKLLDANTLLETGNAPAGTAVSEDGSRIRENAGNVIRWHSTMGAPTVTTPADGGLTSTATRISVNGQAVLLDDRVAVLEPLRLIDVKPQHALNCSSTWARALDADLNGRIAVGYSDGWVELRSPDGQLERAVQVSSTCSATDLVRFNADGSLTVAVNVWSEAGMAARFYQVNDTVKLLHHFAGLSSMTASSRGTRVVLPSRAGMAGFSPATGAWLAEPPVRLVRMNLHATYQNRDHYTFTGSMTLSERTYQVTGKAVGMGGAEFRPQNARPAVFWNADLLENGAVIGKLDGSQHFVVRDGQAARFVLGVRMDLASEPNVKFDVSLQRGQ